MKPWEVSQFIRQAGKFYMLKAKRYLSLNIVLFLEGLIFPLLAKWHTFVFVHLEY